MQRAYILSFEFTGIFLLDLYSMKYWDEVGEVNGGGKRATGRNRGNIENNSSMPAAPMLPQPWG